MPATPGDPVALGGLPGALRYHVDDLVPVFGTEEIEVPQAAAQATEMRVPFDKAWHEEVGLGIDPFSGGGQLIRPGGGIVAYRQDETVLADEHGRGAMVITGSFFNTGAAYARPDAGVVN